MTTLFRNLSIETFEFVWDEFIEIHDSILRTERKRKKVGSRIKYHPPFKETPQDRAFKIDTEYNMILKVLLLKPDINPIEIAAELNSKLQNIKQDYLVKKIKQRFNDGTLSKRELILRLKEIKKIEDRKNKPKANDTEYRKVQRMVKDLLDIYYIEKTSDVGEEIGNIKNKASFRYRLSLNGLFYVLINNPLFDFDFVFVSIFKNYPTNKLFDKFLYPYFELHTLDKLNLIHPLLTIYLKDVCELISNEMHWINSDNKIQEGNVESLLFKWNIKSKSMNLLPENNYNWTYLKQYLREKLGWEWVINAKIILDDDNNTIAVKHDLTSNHAIVYINLREKRASVRYDGENLDIFKVIEQEDTLLISKTLSTIKELRNNGFKNGFYRLLVLLILNINLNYSGEPENSSIKKAQILGNDKEFVQVTQKIIKILQESIKQ